MTTPVQITALITLFTLSACHHSKKTTATTPPAPTNPQAVVRLDTAKTPVNEAPKREIYRASNAKTNDIIHTKLEVSFDWAQSRMNGKATLQIKPYFYPTNVLYLNARGMEIKKLEVFESTSDKKRIGSVKTTDINSNFGNLLQTAFYKYENDSLKINLAKQFTADEIYYVVIEYVAKPNELKSSRGSNAISDDKGLYFINPTGENPYKMPQIWTQGETQANSVWMPTIDSPNEKMTQEIYMTVQDKFTTLSNGLLVDVKRNADGTRTDHWKLDEPHSPYLAMMAVGEFKKVLGEPWNGKEISYYVEKEYEKHASVIFGDTREMIDFYSKVLGVPYVWPKYAQIVARDYVSGAMENTSATLHGDFMVYQTAREMLDGKKGNSVIAHELFHQWFGDLVTCESWSNLSLNESFATYGEYLWEEYKFGRDAADYHHWQSRQGYIGSQKEANLIRYNYNDKEDMFDGISYNKGGQILHMLRKAVGDKAFFASLKNYLETNKYKSGEIHNLRLAFEEITGTDLNWFFDQWFLNKGRPKLRVTKKYNAQAGGVELTVEQNQDFTKNPLYTLPIEVDLYVNGLVERTHITVTEQKQTFFIKSGLNPQLVNFDAERQLLCDIEYEKSTDEYIFQYANAPLYQDRYEALKYLDPKIEEDAVSKVFLTAAANDKFYALRSFAIGRLERTIEPIEPVIKTTLSTIYAKDTKTLVRAKALEVLNKKYGNNLDVQQLNEMALNEMSYAICGEAMNALSQNNPKLAMEKAKALENEEGKDILYPIANLYANHGADEQISFFHQSLKHFAGFELVGFCASYVKLVKRSSKSENALLAANDLESLSKGAGRFVKYASLKGIKDILSAWEVKETQAKTELENAKKENKNTSDIENSIKKITETKETLSKIYSRSK